MFRSSLLLVGLLVLVLGCGAGVKPKSIEIKPSGDPLTPARTILNRYANGDPLGSEVTSFPKLIEDLRKADPERATLVEKGLAEIQKSPTTRVAKAKALLQQLKPTGN